MPSDSPSIEEKIEGRENWIPIISAVLLLVGALVTDLDYWVLETGSTLFFYAVLVQMWTELGPDEPIFVSRDWQFFEFILMAVGAVIVGFVIREAVTSITGGILAIQSLALGIMFSRWYINAKNAPQLSFNAILRYRDPFDQRLVLVPCSFAFLLPVFQNRIGILVYDFDTPSGFTGLISLSIGAGLLFHMYKTGELEKLYNEIQSN